MDLELKNHTKIIHLGENYKRTELKIDRYNVCT